MLKRIEFSLLYENTEQGMTDRNAFREVCNDELLGDNIVPEVIHGDNAETSFVSVFGDGLTSSVFFTNNNIGTSNWNTFWSKIESEWDKATILYKGMTSSGRKHDCAHDGTSGGCKNYTYLTAEE